MKTLALITDAFGNHGGIAKFNRDVLSALCFHPDCQEVLAFPRLMSMAQTDPRPEKLTYNTEGLNSKLRYAAALGKNCRKRIQFDIILCGHINLVPLAFLCAKVHHAPVLLFIHGIDAWQPNKNRLVNLLIKHVDATVAVSAVTRRRFLDWSGLEAKRVHVCHNSIDLNGFSPGPKNERLVGRYSLRGKQVILTLGRLSCEGRFKGFDEVLEVMPALSRVLPNLVYMIAGAGPDMERLREKAHRLNIADKVIFTGFVAEDEKQAHYRLADVYAMPSRGEGFGIVLLEAMACGIPVVGSKADGSYEALRGGKLGILVDPTRPADVKAGILAALQKPTGVTPNGLSYFSVDQFRKRLFHIINHVVR